MAKVKQAGKTAQQSNRPGKRLGVKVFGGERVKIGAILVRQKGTKFHPDRGVKTGRDHTLYAVKDGLVEFKRKQGRTVIAIQ